MARTDPSVLDLSMAPTAQAAKAAQVKPAFTESDMIQGTMCPLMSKAELIPVSQTQFATQLSTVPCVRTCQLFDHESQGCFLAKGRTKAPAKEAA